MPPAQSPRDSVRLWSEHGASGTGEGLIRAEPEAGARDSLICARLRDKDRAPQRGKEGAKRSSGEREENRSSWTRADKKRRRIGNRPNLLATGRKRAARTAAQLNGETSAAALRQHSHKSKRDRLPPDKSGSKAQKGIAMAAAIAAGTNGS